MREHAVRSAIVGALCRVVKMQPEQTAALHDPHSDFLLSDLAIDSLDALELCMEIETIVGVELDPAELVALDTVSELVGLVVSKDRPAGATIVRASRDQPVPLSLAQESIWAICQNRLDHSGYVLSMIDKIEGPLDIAMLADCLTSLISRHEILRTTFPFLDGRPIQMVHPVEKVALPVFSVANDEDPEQTARKIIRHERLSVCDFTNGPLVKFAVMRISAQEHLLIRSIHHMVWDGWSGKLFLDELSSLYEAAHFGKPAILPEMKLQYADYAAWQRSGFDPAGQTYHDAVAWWAAYLESVRSPIDLPFKRPELLAGVDPDAGRLVRSIEPGLMDRLNELRGEGGTTLYRIWLAGFVAVLWLETHCSNRIIGSFVTGRRHWQLRNMIGDFSNTVALKLECDVAISFKELISQVDTTVTEAESYSEIPFDKLSAELEKRNTVTPPINVIFAAPLDNRLGERRFANLTISRYGSQGPLHMPWGCTLQLREQDGNYRCVMDFDAGLYDPSLVEMFMDHLYEFLDAVSRNPDLAVGEFRRVTRGPIDGLTD